jgi:hypothetical protein
VIRGYRGAAIQLRDGSAPAHVFGNTLVGSEPLESALRLQGPTGIVAENQVQAEQEVDGEREASGEK